MTKARDNNVLIILHSDHGDPGYVGESLQTAGYVLDVVRTSKGEPLPKAVDDYAGVVSFGGPMSANDEHLPFIAAELRFLPTVLAGRPWFLGVCLGAQLVARVLGGEVAPHPDGVLEAGWFPIEPADGGNELFDEPMTVYHFHQEGLTLPRGATLLATGDVFHQQAFALDDIVGVQFHPEMMERILERWMDKAAHKLVRPGAQPPPDHFDGLVRHGPAMHDWTDRLIEYLDTAVFT